MPAIEIRIGQMTKKTTQKSKAPKKKSAATTKTTAEKKRQLEAEVAVEAEKGWRLKNMSLIR